MKNRLSGVLMLIISALLLAGCQAIFTTGFLSFLQRDPSKMSLDQRIYYAEQALASGDAEYIEAAYDALKDDAAASNDPALLLLAAELATELSGVNDIAADFLDDGIDLTGDQAANAAVFDALYAGLDTAYLTEAGDFYEASAANGGDLNATDYVIGAAVLVTEGMAGAATPGDFNTLVAADVADAVALLDVGIGALDPADPSYDVLSDFRDYLFTQIT